MKSNRAIAIARPKLGLAEWEAVKGPITSGWVTQGIRVRRFERAFAKRHQASYAFAVSNCTAALHLALTALGIKRGDEVLAPAFSWVATANAVEYCGAKPVFVDINLSTFNIDPAKIKGKITLRTKAVIVVHLFGLSADLDAIRRVAPQLTLIEDAACAAGSFYKGKPVGCLGEIGCFSFHPRKVVTTGEGGMLTTNDKKLAKMIEMLRNHGASVSEEKRHRDAKPWDLSKFNILGYNYRMTDIQGAIGLVQIKKLDAFIKERDKWAGYYQDKLSDLEWLTTPKIPQGFKNNWQSFVCMVDERKSPYTRNKIMEILLRKGIATRPGTHAIHLLGFYRKKYILKPSDYPNAYRADKYSMAIPLHNTMSKDDYDYVIAALHSL